MSIRLFAGLRERAGTGARELELRDGATVADVWAALELGDEPPGPSVRGQQALRGRRHGARRRRRGGRDPARLRRRLPAQRRAALARRRRRARFATTARARSPRSRGRCATAPVTGRCSTSSTRPTRGWPRRRWPSWRLSCRARHELCAIAIHHRVGRVEIGEPSVVIAVSSPHRAAALAACKEAIDTLKGTVPLWKKEVYEGGEEWIGQGS